MTGEDFNRSVLDTIDFLPYIEKYRGRDIWEMITELERKYNDTPLTNNIWLEGCLFNWLNESEVIDYLTERYSRDQFEWHEVSKYVID